MQTSTKTIAVLIGFLAGVLSYLSWHMPYWALFAIFLIGIFAYALLRKQPNCIIFLFIMGLAAGSARANLSQRIITADDLDSYHGQKVTIEGIITQVDIRREHAKYKLSAKKVYDNTSSHKLQILGAQNSTNIQGNVLITMNKYPEFHYGDKVRLSGELKAPGNFNGFAYDNYLSRYGIYSVMYRPWMKTLESGHGNFFWRGMTWLQNKFMAATNSLLPEPHASFEAGLLVGARKGIPPDLMEKFNITGLTHIIAISGYNITIIIVFVMWALKAFSRRNQFIIAISAIVLFTLFVGASPAVVRASIMGILGLIALHYGRDNNIHLTILFSAAFMVAWNPKILWWDVGFQLSFAAVLGLIYVAPHFEKYAAKLPAALGIRESIVLTMAAQVTALPIIVYNFGRLSLIAPIANLAVAFALPLAMLLGFIAVLLSFIIKPLALIFAYANWVVLGYIIKVIELMSAVPYASIDAPQMSLWMLGAYYIVLIAILVYLKPRLTQKA